MLGDPLRVAHLLRGAVGEHRAGYRGKQRARVTQGPGRNRQGVEMKERGQRLSRTREDQGTCQPLNSLVVVS